MLISHSLEGQLLAGFGRLPGDRETTAQGGGEAAGTEQLPGSQLPGRVTSGKSLKPPCPGVLNCERGQ